MPVRIVYVDWRDNESIGRICLMRTHVLPTACKPRPWALVGVVCLCKGFAGESLQCHIEIQHYMLRDWMQKDEILIKHIGSDTNKADGLTKTLAIDPYTQFVSIIGISRDSPLGSLANDKHTSPPSNMDNSHLPASRRFAPLRFSAARSGLAPGARLGVESSAARRSNRNLHL
ncbi:hypothetical protein CIRG_05008 [Coccidioides immitis RMSCC 2394]|uniref:Uncharacterized protein n=1 Tax=Coccidioides immitis RMSCC 2394 TaxID=404692 RepID=A0A0J7B5Y1_COCIT|nr:hypothetical protein CIRG_05008 [Coccidioides immitis RMSCC 2394]